MSTSFVTRDKAWRAVVLISISGLLTYFVILPIWDYYFRSKPPSLNEMMKMDEPRLLAQLREKGDGAPAPVKTENTQPHVEPIKEPKRSVAEIAIVDEWLKRVGYFPDDLVVYRTYSEQILVELIGKGDTNAMYVMSERNLLSGGRKAAKPFAEKGIIYGSLSAIRLMEIYTSPLIGVTIPYDQAKTQLKESFAYRTLLAMRGDTFNASLGKGVTAEMFEKSYNVKNPLTPEDEVWIQARAKELYDHYQVERNKLGLGDFDNEMPKEVKDFLGVK